MRKCGAGSMDRTRRTTVQPASLVSVPSRPTLLIICVPMRREVDEPPPFAEGILNLEGGSLEALEITLA
jgi:hypothetical protein